MLTPCRMAGASRVWAHVEACACGPGGAQPPAARVPSQLLQEEEPPDVTVSDLHVSIHG